MGAFQKATEAGIEAGRSAFNRGQFFEAHELWEEVWRGLEGDPRTQLQGLIQVAAGLHHLGRQRPRPAARLLKKGLEKLRPDPPAALAHLRLGALGRQLRQLLTRIDAGDVSPPDPGDLQL
jgi:uncharacterized protein